MIPYTGYEKARVQQMVEDICYNNAKNYFKF
jgi:glucuronate isomerase